MNFWEWLFDNYGITWNEFDENYDFSSGQGKQYYQMYCEDMGDDE